MFTTRAQQLENIYLLFSLQFVDKTRIALSPFFPEIDGCQGNQQNSVNINSFPFFSSDFFFKTEFIYSRNKIIPSHTME